MQEHCPSLDTCIPAMCRLALSPAQPSCPPGHLSCGPASCIQNQCLALVLRCSAVIITVHL